MNYSDYSKEDLSRMLECSLGSPERAKAIIAAIRAKADFSGSTVFDGIVRCQVALVEQKSGDSNAKVARS